LSLVLSIRLTPNSFMAGLVSNTEVVRQDRYSGR
jgi:hypothetical protein